MEYGNYEKHSAGARNVKARAKRALLLPSHHRICDAQKHLLHTLDKPKEKIIDNYIIKLTIQHNL